MVAVASRGRARLAFTMEDTMQGATLLRWPLGIAVLLALAAAVAGGGRASAQAGQAGGCFSPRPVAGLTLVAYAGGTVAGLERCAAVAGARVHRAAGEGWIALDPRADDEANAAFRALYAGGVPAGELFLLAAEPRAPFRLGLLQLGAVDYLFHGTEPDSREGPTVRAALLAVRHVNAAGGVFGQPVEVRFADIYRQVHERTAPEHSVTWHALRLLDEEGVHAFVGPGASVSVREIAGSVAAPRGVPFISPIASSPFVADLEDRGFVFRTNISDAMQGQALAELASEEGYDHVALVHRDNAWGNALAEVFKAHFEGRITNIGLHPGAESYADEIHHVADSNAPVLISLTFHDDMFAVLDEVVEHGHFEAFLLNNFHRNLDLLEAYPVLEGAKGIAPLGQHVTEAEGHWEADYEAAYGEVPHVAYMREAYDAVIALTLAAEYAGSGDGAAVRDALAAVGNPPGARWPASSAGVRGALEAIRNGGDIDLDGEATDLNWDGRGEIVDGDIVVWQFRDGAIADLRHITVVLTE